MPKYKIVASDLDGTLLNTRVEISKENLAAIKEMTEMGVLFVPSSGRAYTEIPEKVRSIPGARYIICSDGATVYDQQEHQHLCHCYMEKELSKTVLDILNEYQTVLTVRYDGKCYVDAAKHDWTIYEEHRLSKNYQEFIYEHDIPVKDYNTFCYNLPHIEMICVFFKSNREMAECKERLLATGLLQVAPSEPYDFEIFHKDAGKGNALLRLADHLGIPKEATIGVGDSLNDLDHIRKAGLGLAMENAFEALKVEADKIICNNDEHAMKYILENFLK
ncbi:MAG: HAD family phosphatase [Clostridia bacterium]|nr:HAD family phosphatase [Clostridia bacterium]